MDRLSRRDQMVAALGLLVAAGLIYVDAGRAIRTLLISAALLGVVGVMLRVLSMVFPSLNASRAIAGVGVVFFLFDALYVFDLQRAAVLGTIGGATYGFVALGLVLVYKSSGVFNFAQGEFGTVAVFALWLGTTNHLPYGLAIVIALAASVLMGVVTERVVIRPLFDAPRVTLLVATAGVSLLAIGFEIWLGEPKLRAVGPALGRLGRTRIFGASISDQEILVIVSLLVLGILLAIFFNRTNLGLAILGASQEPTATELVGISVKRLSGFTWALAALLGGLAGVLSTPIAKTFGPGALTTGALIPGFTAAVLGGMTSLPGAFLGGAIVGVAQSVAVTAKAFEDIPGQSSLVVFILLVLVLTVRPQGILGKSE
jgi:branched-chain amino acid transport system permease protein